MATKSLYVGNLPYSTTEEDLKTMFEAYGPIAEVRVISNKGFGFVDVPEETAQAAIDAINGQQAGGRTLTVNEARPRTERTGGFGGDRGGNRGGGGGYGGGGGGRRNDW